MCFLILIIVILQYPPYLQFFLACLKGSYIENHSASGSVKYFYTVLGLFTELQSAKTAIPWNSVNELFCAIPCHDIFYNLFFYLFRKNHSVTAAVLWELLSQWFKYSKMANKDKIEHLISSWNNTVTFWKVFCNFYESMYSWFSEISGDSLKKLSISGQMITIKWLNRTIINLL